MIKLSISSRSSKNSWLHTHELKRKSPYLRRKMKLLTRRIRMKVIREELRNHMLRYTTIDILIPTYLTMKKQHWFTISLEIISLKKFLLLKNLMPKY